MAAAAALGAGGLLTACGDDESSSGSDPAADTGSAQTRHSITAMMPFPLSVNFIGDIAATSAGFMDDVGVDLTVEFAQTAPMAFQQLLAGNVTVIRNGPVETIQAIVDEDAPLITIGMPNQRTNYTLTSTPDDALTVVDLSGRTVGLPSLGSNAEFSLDIILRGAGIEPGSVQRQAVGIEASAYGLMQEGVVDALLTPRSTVASIRAMGEEPHVELLEDVNPLLGTNLVTTRQYAEERRDAIVAYLRGLHAAMLALNDDARVPELVDAMLDDGWDLPQLTDLDTARPVIASIASRWFEDGEENLLRNIPERWEEGVADLKDQGVIPDDVEATDLYTNDLLEEALA